MPYKKTGKRIFDWILILIACALAGWLVLLILLMYVVLMEFPVLFVQTRVGQGRKTFQMWKFRTLAPDESLPAGGRSFALGKWLRFTSLDELPQLWNIVRGEMSFIGPRPLPAEYLPLYSEAQNKRHEVKPGITGWAQVNGRNSISWQKKFELDVYYVNHLSFKLDLLIMIKTLVLVLSFRKDVSLTEEKFKGN
ncbi:MAG TPA: sugar transferase [Cyclobacteriaceae bacterium]|nr:sugar transferase [Cyclobacteriaceae bacterium]